MTYGHLQADCLYTGISSGPTLGIEYGKGFTFTFLTAITRFKVTDFGTNLKLMYDFQLLINTNVLPILHRFLDIAVDRSEIATFCYPSCV